MIWILAKEPKQIWGMKGLQVGSFHKCSGFLDADWPAIFSKCGIGVFGCILFTSPEFFKHFKFILVIS